MTQKNTQSNTTKKAQQMQQANPNLVASYNPRSGNELAPTTYSNNPGHHEANGRQKNNNMGDNTCRQRPDHSRFPRRQCRQ